MAMHNISFEVTRVPDIDENDMACQRAWVSAVIDGRRLGTSSSPVDVYHLLASQGLSCDHTFLTCSCGVPGCAGLQGETLQRWSDSLVEWRLDAEDYRHKLSFVQPAAPGAKYLVLQFSTSQLEQALLDLKEQLTKCMSDGPVHLSPGGDLNSTASLKDLESDIAAQRSWILENKARQEHHERLFGRFCTTTVVARFSGGLVLEANAARVLQHLLMQVADASGIVLAVEVARHVESAVGALRDKVTANPYSLRELLAAGTWGEDWYLWQVVLGARPSEAPDWARASLEMRLDPAE